MRRRWQRFGTTTPDLLALTDWLRGHGVTHVAIEGTGVYWKPIYYALEGEFELLLVNAAHVKQVPGRKTDTKDAVPGCAGYWSAACCGRASCRRSRSGSCATSPGIASR